MATGLFRAVKPVAPVVAIATAALSCLALGALIARARYGMCLFFMALTAVVFAVPLSVFQPSTVAHDFPAYRLVFLLAAYFAFVIPLSAHFLACDVARRPALGFLTRLLTPVLLFIIASVALSSRQWIAAEREITIRPLAEEGRFFMSGDTTALLVKRDPLNGGTHYFENLAFFREHLRGDSPPAVAYRGFVFPDEPDAPELRGRRAFSYDPAQRSLAEITPDYPGVRGKLLSSLSEGPLSVDLTVKSGLISFTLGPAEKGRYFVLWGHRPGFYSMMIDLGALRSLKTRGLTRLKVYWRFGWESPEGLITLSPEWFVDFARETEISWKR
jgi:hypothetical protein